MGAAVTGTPEVSEPTPNVYIQWKGTEACLDLRCRCGTPSHYDGGFAYALRCPHCQRVFTLPTTLAVTDGDNGADAQDAVDTWGQS